MVSRRAGSVIIAEVAQAHEGSLGIALSLIDAVAEAGADCIKFQHHSGYHESSIHEKFRIPPSGQDASRYDYWQRMSFTERSWKLIIDRCDRNNLEFMCTPFSVFSVKQLFNLGCRHWKVGSGDVGFEQLLQELFDLPRGFRDVTVSSGMSSYKEIDTLIDKMRPNVDQLALLQCTSKYPTPLNEVGLQNIDFFAAKYPDLSIGLSDHSGTVFPGLLGLAREIDLLEVHITFDKRIYGPDASSSITVDELAFLVEARNSFRELSLSCDKDVLAEILASQKKQFDRSLAPVCDLSKGAEITEDLLTMKKPGGGLPWDSRHKIVGRRARRRIMHDELLKLEDFE